ncbi:MAG TPA: agmatinase [Blastocatellia bacterium]|jgi:agmatinase|nr:agmatinase [Blastocatellia bacterium]
MSESQHLPFNFGGIAEPEYSNFESSRILVWPVPYEGTVSYGHGAARGPRAIIEASRNMELYDEEIGGSVYRLGIHTLEELPAIDPPEAMMNQIEARAEELLDTGKFLVMLGGEHSITGPVIRVLGRRVKNLSVLQIDAHADLRESYDGTIHSHASIMARAVEVCPVVQVGIRSISEAEAKRLPNTPTKIYWAKDVVGRTDWHEDALSHLTENVYLTIDIDGLDPSLVPTTGTPEPGGLGWYDALGIIRALARSRNIVGMDVTELAPVEGNPAPDFLTAKLVYKSLSYIFENEVQQIQAS